MDPTKGKARQTNIIDDPVAIARAMQGGQRKSQPKKKKEKNVEQPNIVASQSASSTKTKPMKEATADDGPRFYQNNGLKIPLYDRSGKKRIHARLSLSLRNKNLDQLLDIVEEYAGAGKKKQMKDANVTKANIADWIEAAEARALPAHPKSHLPAAAQEQKHTESHQSLLRNRVLAAKDIRGKGNGKAVVQDNGTSIDSKEDVKEHATDPATSKPKRDNVTEPTHASQQTPKKPKTHHTHGQQTRQSHARHKEDDGQANVDARKVRFGMPTVQPSEGTEVKETPVVPIKNDSTEDQARKAENLEKFIRDVHIHPADPDGSTKIVHLGEERQDRILTVSTLKTGRTIMHDTPIPHSYGKSRVLSAQQAHVEQLFLKKGIHGRHGDFENDSDRRTGRGHQFTPEDERRLHHYIACRGGSAGRSEEEKWYSEFTKKYGGYAVSHLWPCGCEKLRGESEGEESEEE